ncbi:MAG: MarR family winged helix-turn-helix transcriptional regulator [Devosia sp.]
MSPAMSDDFSQCLVTNSRMAARAITRRYDAYLRPFGLTATQLSLLGGLRELAGATVSEIADNRGFDRTTLTRNLDRLEAIGFVVSTHPAHGNGRIAEITPKGNALIEQLLPLWREAQAEMQTELSRDTFDLSLKMLKRLAKV